jgi:transposase
MDVTPPLPSSDPAEDAHTTGRKSARMSPIEVITRGERRRVWTPEQKREIVVESLGPALTPTEVARKYGISSGLLYGWRQKILGGQMTLTSRSPPSFAQVEMTSAPPRLSVPGAQQPDELGPASPPAVLPRMAGLIEILLPDGVTVRVDAEVDGAALRRVMGALKGR